MEPVNKGRNPDKGRGQRAFDCLIRLPRPEHVLFIGGLKVLNFLYQRGAWRGHYILRYFVIISFSQ